MMPARQVMPRHVNVHRAVVAGAGALQHRYGAGDRANVMVEPLDRLLRIDHAVSAVAHERLLSALQFQGAKLPHITVTAMSTRRTIRKSRERVRLCLPCQQ